MSHYVNRRFLLCLVLSTTLPIIISGCDSHAATASPVASAPAVAQQPLPSVAELPLREPLDTTAITPVESVGASRLD